MKLPNISKYTDNYINEKKIKNKIREIENLIIELGSFNELLEKDIWEIYNDTEDTKKLQRCLNVVYDIIININLFLEYKWIWEKFLINIRNTGEIGIQINEFEIIETFYKQWIIELLSGTELESLKNKSKEWQFYSPSKHIIHTYSQEFPRQFTGTIFKISKVLEKFLPSYMTEVSDIGIYSENMAEEDFLEVLGKRIKEEINNINSLIWQISQFEENNFDMLKFYINEFIDIYKQIPKILLNIDINTLENLIEIYINPLHLKNEINLGKAKDIIKITIVDFNHDGSNYQVDIDKKHIIIQNKIICLKFKNGFDNKIWFGSKYIKIVEKFLIDFFNAISDKIINILGLTDSINTLDNRKAYKIKLIHDDLKEQLQSYTISNLEKEKSKFLWAVFKELWIDYNIDWDYVIIYENDHNTQEKLQYLISALNFNLE